MEGFIVEGKHELTLREKKKRRNCWSGKRRGENGKEGMLVARTAYEVTKENDLGIHILFQAKSLTKSQALQL